MARIDPRPRRTPTRTAIHKLTPGRLTGWPDLPDCSAATSGPWQPISPSIAFCRKLSICPCTPPLADLSEDEVSLLTGLSFPCNNSLFCKDYPFFFPLWQSSFLLVGINGCWLTVPASHKRVVTSIAKAIQTMIFLPFARISSA
jgi:hypothetical protein